jgi:uncharacterized protein YjiS (DUF1127 family)
LHHSIGTPIRFPLPLLSLPDIPPVQISKAIQSYRKALTLKPNFPEATANLIQSQLSICDWSSYKEDILKLQELTRDQLAAVGKNILLLPSVQPFHSLAYPFSLEEILQVPLPLPLLLPPLTIPRP